MKRLIELINRYKRATPPPRFGFVAPLSACFDELETSGQTPGQPITMTAPVNIAFGNIIVEGDVGLLADYSLWLWLSETSGRTPANRSEQSVLTRVFGVTPRPFDAPLVGTWTDKGCEFRLWRNLPAVQSPTVAESVSDKTQKPVFSLHARNGEATHMTEIVKMLTRRCDDQWPNAFRVWTPDDIPAKTE